MAKARKNKKVAVLSVTNDLTADYRVHKVALSLKKCGFYPLLIGINLKSSLPITNRTYATKRISLFFKKGPLFYAEYNIRLFLFLLFQNHNLLISNDLDTLLANYLINKIKLIFGDKKHKLIYDSHEFFTEVPELNNRFAKKVWLFIEKIILPKIKYSYTVCNSIAEEYKKRYNIKMMLVRNIPLCNKSNSNNLKHSILHNKITNKKIIIYQGALNIGRGIEQLIYAMEFIENVVFIIIGDGAISSELKKLVTDKKLTDKVQFIGKIPFVALSEYTKNADIGVVLQEDLSLSYRYVLPNRIFDYIHAELPFIASDLPEISKIVSENKIGVLVTNMNPENLAKEINNLLNNTEKYQEIKTNLKSAKGKYCWENEEKKLIELFSSF